MINTTIDGIAKLLAYGDYIKARTSQRNETIFSILDEEISQYDYLRKPEAVVRYEHLVHNLFNNIELLSNQSGKLMNKQHLLCTLFYRFLILLQLISAEEKNSSPC